MSTVNLGILAHVDAGKTSLTERLLFAAGVIDHVGRVDDGSTQTDSLALERQRGITIKSAVASFAIGDVTVNLIDTPGHPDFIAEVERALGVLDGAVLVISAVEGVQAQTRVLFRALRRLRIPTLLFVNKIDRRGADCARVVRNIADKLSPAIVTGESELIEVLAEHDDTLLAAYVDGRPVPDLRGRLVAQTRKALVHPVFFGSASTGAGIDELMAGIAELLPAAPSNADGPLSGTVFKVERGPAGEKIAYVRLFSGTIRMRDQVRGGKVTAIGGGDTTAVTAGQIGKLWGLNGIRIGDAIGDSHTPTERHFSPPTLETVVVPAKRAARGALHSALTQLAEQDPLINLRQDDVRGEIYLSLYGEVQKEVIQATLADEFGVDVTFRETTTLHIERPVGIGTAMETISKGANPFLATIGLRVEPGEGITFRLGIELGSLPFSFIKAVEETVAATLRQGLHGWQVTDCAVTLTRSGYWPRQSHAHATFDKSMSSTAGDFRNLTPLVLMDALRAAGTQVYEPMHRFHLDVPADTLGAVLPVLIRSGAVPLTQSVRGSSCLLEGDVPAARVHELQRQLPSLTRGEAMMDAAFDHYQPVRGPAPTRSRSDHNPLNRKEYLLHVMRRV
jgi:ribosomal protection tetracycline resistance protein